MVEADGFRGWALVGEDFKLGAVETVVGLRIEAAVVAEGFDIADPALEGAGLKAVDVDEDEDALFDIAEAFNAGLIVTLLGVLVTCT